MNEEYLAHIFEPFSQESDGPRTDYNGTGLGMSIVKRLVDQMDGEIQVESRKNKGSRFIILLPLKTAQEECMAEKTAQDQAGSTKIHGKILLAEDGKMNREIAEYLLADAGLSIVSVENGRAGGGRFRQLCPLGIRRRSHGYHDAGYGRTGSHPPDPRHGQAGCKTDTDYSHDSQRLP